MNSQRTYSGFTLIEVMITVAIIGILAAVALPSYNDYIRRSALSDGFASMSDMRIKLEQFYQNNRGYGTPGELAPCGHDGTDNRVSFAGSGGRFSYACALTGDPGQVNQRYTITATGSISAANDHIFTLDSNNVKRTTRFKGATVDKACWLSKGGEC